MERLLLSIMEAADLLGVQRTTLYLMLQRGDLESVHIGRLRKVPRAAVERYVQRLTGEPAEAGVGR